MATLWERTPQRLPPAEPLPLRGDSSDGFQGFFSEFCSEKATSSPVFMRELPTASRGGRTEKSAAFYSEAHGLSTERARVWRVSLGCCPSPSRPGPCPGIC